MAGRYLSFQIQSIFFMRKFTLNIFIAATLLVTSAVNAQSAFSLLRTNPHPKKNTSVPEYQRVKIWFDGKSPVELAKSGIDLSEGDYRKNVWYVSDLDMHMITKVRNAGFRVDVIIEDVKAFYKNRNETSRRNPETPNTQTVSCGITSPSYPMPAHFHHGSMDGFYTYVELQEILDSMALLYPNLITTKAPIDATQSIEGNDIFYLKISDNPTIDEAEPEVLYTALHHAREPESITQLIYYMWYLLENYSTDQEIQKLVDNTEMFFVPCLNPDGYMYNEFTDPNGGGMWRKNRRDNLDGEFGVDLNRNYGYNWGFDDTGSSPFTSEETYRGTSAFSEPETQALRNFINTRQFKFALNYHTYGNHLVIPWGYQTMLTPDSQSFDFYGHAIARYNNYHVGTGIVTVGYVTNGGSDDWMYGEQVSKGKIFSMTPEVGDAFDGFWPDPSRIDFLSESNVYANLTMAKLAGRYGELSYDAPRYNSNISSTFPFVFHALGLDTSGSFMVSLTPVSSNIISVGNPVVFTTPSLLLDYPALISFTLDAGITPGDMIQYAVTLSNGWYTTVDTVTQYFGTPTIALNDNGSDISNWNSFGSWDVTPEDYVSGPTSITDSPFNTYQPNENSSLTLASPVSLIGAVDAVMTFSAKWDIERGFDFVQVSASADGGSTWNPLCGKYTVAGSNFQVPGEPLYDGTKREWVNEEMNLNDYLGQNIQIRFSLMSDNFSEFDGFYFDDLKIEYLDSTGVGIQTAASDLFLSQPVPNPSTNIASMHYYNVAQGAEMLIYDVYGQLVWKKNISGSGKVEIPTGDFSKGMYSCFVQLPDGSVSKAKKLIKN
jgi:carboxypeptidase T